MTPSPRVHTNSARWLMKACRLLMDDRWPVDMPLTFDGLDHEVAVRDEAALIFFEAARDWGKARKIVIRNLCLGVSSKEKLEALLESSTQLESLTMTKISTTNGGMQFLSRSLFSSNKQIQELTIDNCRIRRQDAILLQRILGVGSLQVLNLRNIDLAETVPMISPRLAHCSLTKLDLSGCRMSQDSLVELLKGLSANMGIKTLVLQNSGIGSRLEKNIDELFSSNTCLEKLDLTQNDISGSTIESWAQGGLLRNKSLRCLVLSQNPIGDTGAKALTELLIANPTIHSLSVIDCDIWGPGCTSLAAGLAQMKGLRDLFVDGEMEDLADTVLKSLESNMTLRHLWTDRAAYLIHKDRRWRQVEFLLRLNRGKRRILVEPNVPLPLWAHVLEGVCGDPRLTYYLLRQKPEVAIGRH